MKSQHKNNHSLTSCKK